MAYSNPLSIFDAAQIEKLTVDNLKSLKKETLLYFQLSDEATIERNGRQLDKNQVLEIFNTLQSDLDLHLKIYNNQPLLEFLENKNMDFFSDTTSQQAILNDNEYKTQINDILAEALNKYTSTILANPRFSALGQLQLIASYAQQAGQTFQDKAYAKSYRELKAFVDKNREKYTTPFMQNEGLAFHPDLDKQVNPLLYRCFEFLPGPFRDIAFLYAAWCHNDIFNKVVTRESNFTKYKRLNLKTISKAIEIAVNVSDNDSLKRSGHEVREILKGKAGNPQPKKRRPENPTRDKSESEIKLPKFNRKYAKIGLLVILGIILALMLLSKFTGQNYTPVEPNSKSSEQKRLLDTKNKRLETKEPRKSQTTSNSSRTNNKVTSKYIGDDLAICNAAFVNSEEINGVLHLNYNVDIFPTKTDQFMEFVPNSIREQYSGLSKNFRLNFFNRDLKGRIFSHDFSATLADQRNGVAEEYVYEGDNPERIRNKIALPSSRIPRKKKLHGSITKFNTVSNEKVSSQSFEIAIDNSITPLPPKPYNPTGNDPEDLSEKDTKASFDNETFNPWHKYRISNSLDQKYKNIILHNFNQIAFKSSRFGKTYSIKDLATYQAANAPDFKISEIAPTSAWQRNYTLSTSDNVAIFNVAEKQIDLRIFVQKNTQMVLGYHMTTNSADGKMVELIEAYFD